MLSYACLLIFLIGSGFLIGYSDSSWLWGIIPTLIGGFWGSFNSRFAKLLLNPQTTPTQREKLLETTRILTIMWTLLSIIFVAMGYSFIYFLEPSL